MQIQNKLLHLCKTNKPIRTATGRAARTSAMPFQMERSKYGFAENRRENTGAGGSSGWRV